MSYNIKQYLITNMAADWTHGKRAVQFCHASMAVFFDKMIDTGNPDGYFAVMTEDMKKWKEGSFAKITLKSPDLQIMLDLENKANELNIPTALIKDNGITQADENGMTLAIGPFDITNNNYSSIIENLSKLKLY